MIRNAIQARLLTPLLLGVALLGCDMGRGYPEHDEVAATLRGILDQNPTLDCSEIEVLNESGAGATYRYYTARASCVVRGAENPAPILKHYELRFDSVPDGWQFKMHREVERAFAEDPASRGPAPYTSVSGTGRIVWLALGIPTGVILLVLVLWLLGDRYKLLPAAARRFKLTRREQPHQKKHFDSINPLD